MSDLVGMKFGRLNILEKIKSDKPVKNSTWKCICECGKILSVSRPNLISGHTRSCGCLLSPLINDYEEKREIRFFKFVKKTESCWIWKGSLDKQGYGSFSNRKKTIKAHRYSYGRFIGPLAGGEMVCHKCDNPSCVNPDHLYKGTHKQNMKDIRDRNRWGIKRKKISEKQKQACIILHNNGMSSYEISELLNISVGGVIYNVK